MIRIDVIFILLVVEYWLGSQKWINAKSLIALVILIFSICIYALSVMFQKKHKEDQ